MVPRHVAIIPDGNRRWAKKHNLPPSMGHKQGADVTLPGLLKEAARLKISYFTLWTTSTENIRKRSSVEMQFLFGLLRRFLDTKVKELHAENIKIRTIGNIAAFPQDIIEKLKNARSLTQDNTGMVVVAGLNYGGRDEIMRMINRFIADKTITTVTEDMITQSLDTAGIPDPDLIIRTGNETRLSGFEPWQSVYAELMFLPELFPDFSPEKFQECIRRFESHERRYGK